MAAQEALYRCKTTRPGQVVTAGEAPCVAHINYGRMLQSYCSATAD